MFVIDVHRSRIAGERGKQNVIHVGDGSPNFVNERLPNGKLIEVQSGHFGSLPVIGLNARPNGINIAGWSLPSVTTGCNETGL
jgi:hypothetical protein